MPKSYTIVASFPQALAKHHIQSARVQATSFTVALRRGLAEIMRRPGIKGLRHKVIRLSIVQYTPIPKEKQS